MEIQKLLPSHSISVAFNVLHLFYFDHSIVIFQAMNKIHNLAAVI